MRKKNIVFVMILSIMFLALLNACTFSSTGKPNDAKDNSIEKDISEGDVVKLYGDYIIKSNTKGIFVIHTNEGEMSLAAEKLRDSVNVGDLIVYNDYLISANYYCDILVIDQIQTKNYYTKVQIFDLNGLSQENYDFPVMKELIFQSKLAYIKVYADRLYIANYYTGEVVNRDEDIVSSYVEDGNSVSIKNTKFISPKTKYYDNYATIVSLSLQNFEEEAKSIAYYGSLYELCLFPNAIYPVFKMNRESLTHIITKLSIEDFSYQGSVSTDSQSIVDRYCLTDNGTNLMVATCNTVTGSRLSIYDNSTLELVGMVDHIAPGERLKSVRFNDDFCYIVTFRVTDPVFKINISDPSAPEITDELKIDGFSTYLHLIDEMDLAIGIGYSEGANVKVTLFNVAGDEVKEINSIDDPQLLFFSEAVSDPQRIFIDRTRNLMIITSWSFLETDNNTEEDTDAAYNIVIFTYSPQEIIISKTINLLHIETDKFSEYMEDLIEVRPLIIDNYLYAVKNNSIISYDINNDYLVKNELIFYQTSVVVE